MHRLLPLTLSFVILMPFPLAAQDLVPVAPSARQDSLFKTAITLYDKGAYDEAIEVYTSILKENPAYVAAIAELSMTYFAKQDYIKAVAFAQDGLKFKSGYRPSLYLYLGNSYDVLGKSEDAITAFRNGLAIDAHNYMLHYNLGLAHYRRNELDSARAHFQDALKAKPTHPSSNVALGHVYRAMHKRVPAIFAYSRFLILEPNSNRSTAIAGILRSLLSDSLSVKTTGPGQMTITVNPDSDEVDGNLGTLELSLAMAQTTHFTKDSTHLSPLATIASDLTSFFQITSELLDNGKFEGFCWSYYAPYFATLQRRGFTDVAVHYMFRSIDKDEVLSFMRSHLEKARDFTTWDADYAWPK